MYIFNLRDRMDAKKASDIALFNVIGVVISQFIWSPIELIVGIIAVLAGINGLSKINKEKVLTILKEY